MSIFIGGVEITDSTKIKVGATDVSEVYVGATKVWPPIPAPVADFSGTPVSGEMPLSVVFTDHSTNNPTSWAWDFGDGGTSTQQNPTHIYGTSGTWTVRLMATNSTGSDTVTKTDYITVNTVHAIITGHLIPGATGFSFESDGEFEVTQSGTSTKYPGTGIRAVTGVNDASVIEINLTNTIATSYFKLKNNVWLNLNLKNIGNIITLENSFFGLSKMATFECDANLSNVTNLLDAWNGCTLIKMFPLINTKSVTNIGRAWRLNTGLSNFPKIDTSNVKIFSYAWMHCVGLIDFPELNYSNGISLEGTFGECNKIKAMPAINSTKGTNFRVMFKECTALECLTSIDTRQQTDTLEMFEGCTSLIAPNAAEQTIIKGGSIWTNPHPCPLPLPAMITGHLIPGATGFSFESDGEFEVTQGPKTTKYTGTGIRSVTGVNDASVIEISLINTTATSYFKLKDDKWISLNLKDIKRITTLFESFKRLKKLVTFECDADLRNVTNFKYAWGGCESLTSFPDIDTSSGTDFSEAWVLCIVLTSFPLLVTSAGTNFDEAWNGCESLTSFPVLDVSKGTNFRKAWSGCGSLTSFPVLDVSKGTNFREAWHSCRNLTSFPLLNTSAGTDFGAAWGNLTKITSFPAIDTSSAIDVGFSWVNCQSLICFEGTLDFRNLSSTDLVQGTLHTFNSCPALRAPATTGTPVRLREHSLVGIWTNPNPCP